MLGHLNSLITVQGHSLLSAGSILTLPYMVLPIVRSQNHVLTKTCHARMACSDESMHLFFACCHEMA